MDKKSKRKARWIFTLALISSGTSLAASDAEAKRTVVEKPLAASLTAIDRTSNKQESSRPIEAWQVAARLKGKMKSAPGTLIVDEAGIEFQPTKGSSMRWQFVEIRTLDLGTRRVTVGSYEDRGRLQPGTRKYRFDLQADLPAGVAAFLADRVARPVRNGVPKLEVAAIATVPAFHRTRFGGNNGVLFFRDEGIDYVTKHAGDSRSWRWADIETVSSLSPYEFVVFGYREVYSFELKQSLARDLFDRICDQIEMRQAEELSPKPPSGTAGGREETRLR